MFQSGFRMVQTRAQCCEKQPVLAATRHLRNSVKASSTFPTTRLYHTLPSTFRTVPTSNQLVSKREMKRSFSSECDVKEVWKQADAVCFDVDSTVCTDEGIDVLAAHLGCGEAVANLTKNAMEGSMSYRDSLSARLELMKPSKSSVDKCILEHPSTLSPGMADLVKTLHSKGKQVFLVSGGFKQLILPVAAQLNIHADNVYANVLQFDGDAYDGFDEDQPTSQTGGKAVVVQKLIEEHQFKTVIMVGDGATDMEARPPAAAFVGYGGVVVRTSVKAGADWFVTDFKDLISAL